MKIRVRPGPGLRVTIPTQAGHKNRVLTDADTPPEGVEVERDIYIYRRLMCGDLVEVAPPAAAPMLRAPELHGGDERVEIGE